MDSIGPGGREVAADIDSSLPDLAEGEYPHFVVSAPQRYRWRLVVGITRAIAGCDDLLFTRQLYFDRDLPTNESVLSAAAPLLVEPIATCVLDSSDAPHIASASLDPGQFTEPIGELALSFDPSPFPPELLARMVNLVRDLFVQTGELPPVGIDGWRACLRQVWQSRWSWLQEEVAYGERRQARSWERSQPEDAALLRALVNAIHTEVWQEEQWWWAPDEIPTAEERWERAVLRSEESSAVRAMYAEAFECLGVMIDAVETRKLSVAEALTRDEPSDDPVARHRKLCAHQLALGLVMDAREAEVEHPTIGALYMARGTARYGSLGLTYEEFGSPPVLDVVGAKEASEILGVELPRISRWRKAGTLPPAYADLAMSPIWVRSDIEGVRDGLDPVACTEPPEPTVLLGTAETASLLEVDKSQIGRWRRSPSSGRAPALPEPAVAIKAGPIWRRSDLLKFKFAREEWSSRTRRRAR